MAHHRRVRAQGIAALRSVPYAILASSGFQGDPPLTNAFMHESGEGATGVFCAWLCGPGVKDLTAGEPWTAEFDLRIWPGALEAGPERPGFLSY